MKGDGFEILEWIQVNELQGMELLINPNLTNIFGNVFSS